MRKLLYFQCKCGSTTLEEVMVDVMQSTAFMAAELEGEDDEQEAVPIYMQSSNDDGRVVRFQCRDCGFILRWPQEATDGIFVDNNRLLMQWLKRYCNQLPGYGEKPKTELPNVP